MKMHDIFAYFLQFLRRETFFRGGEAGFGLKQNKSQGQTVHRTEQMIKSYKQKYIKNQTTNLHTENGKTGK